MHVYIFAQHYVDVAAANLRGTAVLLRTGSNDGTVPPFFTRRMARVLTEHSADVTFSEVQQGHWYVKGRVGKRNKIRKRQMYTGNGITCNVLAYRYLPLSLITLDPPCPLRLKS